MVQNIYGQIGQLQMVSQWVCSVSHHITSPSWMDDIKINLPTPLNNKHHLLFTFLHISCDLGKQRKENKDAPGPEVVVGYSWLPLLHKGRLRTEHQCLPVSAHLPPGYLSFEPLGLGRGVSELLESSFCTADFKSYLINSNDQFFLSMLDRRSDGLMGKRTCSKFN